MHLFSIVSMHLTRSLDLHMRVWVRVTKQKNKQYEWVFIRSFISHRVYFLHTKFSAAFFDWAITLNHTKLESHRWWPINLSMFFWLAFVLIYTFNVTCLFFMIWIVFLRTLLFPFFSINFYAGIRLFWNFWCCFSICDFSFLFFFLARRTFKCAL